MSAPSHEPARMTADEFLVWTLDQPTGRYELIESEVVAMAPERAAHNELKLELAIRLREAARQAGLGCQVFTDGMAVRVDERMVFEPDASLRCGERLDVDATQFTDPMIVVEVLSRSTEETDMVAKLDGYFRLPSLQHYLVFRTKGPPLIHHRRHGDGILTRILGYGPLHLDPPGLTLQLGEL